MPARVRYMLPTPENFIRMVNDAIVQNLRNGHEAKVVVPPLVERAYILVNATGVMPVTEFPAEREIQVRQ